MTDGRGLIICICGDVFAWRARGYVHSRECIDSWDWDGVEGYPT